MATKLEKWWDSRSLVFKDYTHGEVVLTHAAVIAMILACGIAEWIGG